MRVTVSDSAPWDAGRVLRLEDLADRVEGSRVRGALVRGRCPCCESRTGFWATVVSGGHARVGCWSCGDWRGIRSALGLDVSGDRVGPHFVPPRKRALPSAPDMVADADALHAVYSVLARHLQMSADQRRNALGRDRGIPPAIRDAMPALLGPVPMQPGVLRALHRALVSDLRSVAMPEFLRRVPELAAREGGSYALFPTGRAALYFEPWRDELGRTVALRAYMGRRAEARYLTSRGRTGPLVHFAFGVPAAETSRVPWVFTEGWMKAEVLAHALGAVGVAFAGVHMRSAWPRALEVLQRMAPDAPAYVAFDAEVWTTRPDLTLAALDLARTIEHATGRAAGFTAWDATVDGDGHARPKGIDDAIVAGTTVRFLDRLAFGAYMGPALAVWERVDAA